MENKKKLMIGGGILLVLAVIAIAMNMSGSGTPDNEAAKMAEKAAETPVPEPVVNAPDPGKPIPAGGGMRKINP